MKIILLSMILSCAPLLQAQDCNDANHSTNTQDTWLSCELAPNPNPVRGNTHWVMYDLGYVYSISTTKFWNYNVSGETSKGMKNIAIDYSLDGTSWMEAATFQLSEASGDPNYEGEVGPHLGSLDARYILITAMDTWGGDCAGLSEVRLDVDGVVPANEVGENQQAIKVFPNPAQEQIFIETDMPLKELIIIGSAGHELVRIAFATQIDISFLPDGVYFLKTVNEANDVRTNRFVKQSQ